MSTGYPSQQLQKIIIRLPNGMRDALAEMAKTNHRSVNAEVVFRLANVLGNQGTTTTGQSFQAHPAVVSEQAALAGGVLFTQATEEPK